MTDTIPTTLTQGQTFEGGTVQYDTATGQKLAPGATTPSTPTSPVVPTTLQFSDINNPTPVTPPTSTNPATSLNALVTSTQSTNNTASTNDTSAETEVDQTSKDLADLNASLGNKTADQNTAEAAQGIPQMDQDLQDLQATASQQNIEYQSTPYSLAGQGRGITTDILRGQEAVKQRQVGLDLLVTNSNIAAKQGNIALAQSLADKAVAAKYDPITAAISAKQALLTQQNTNLSRADQKLVAAQQASLSAQQNQINNQIQNEKDSNAIKQTAIAIGAPNSVIVAMDKVIQAGGDSSQILTLAQGYMSDPLAKKIQEAQLTKLNQDIQNGSLPSVYTAGANPAADAWIQNINSGKAKLSDIPASQSALKNYVQQGLALTGGSTSDILNTTVQSLQELQTMVNTNHGFTSAVGTNVPNPLGIFTDPLDQLGFKNISGTQSADFTAKLNQVKNDVVLPNLTLLHGLGRITDREFQALSSALTSLSPSLSEGQFKSELADITNQINTKVSSQPTTSSNSAIIPKGTDGTAYGFPGYVSDGTQWVPK